MKTRSQPDALALLQCFNAQYFAVVKVDWIAVISTQDQLSKRTQEQFLDIVHYFSDHFTVSKVLITNVSDVHTMSHIPIILIFS